MTRLRPVINANHSRCSDCGEHRAICACDAPMSQPAAPYPLQPGSAGWVAPVSAPRNPIAYEAVFHHSDKRHKFTLNFSTAYHLGDLRVGECAVRLSREYLANAHKWKLHQLRKATPNAQV